MRKIENPDVFRANIIKNLNKQIKKKGISEKLEKGIFDYSSKEANMLKIIIRWDNPLFTELYINRLRSIFINLKNKKLLKDLISGEFKPDTLAFMTHQEMNPEHWKEYIDKKRKRDANKYTNNMQASTDMFTCRKCKSKKCSYYELQTRSADEPSTIFVTCLDCGKNWKS
jgi:transcription elongation factor S-II